MIFVIESWHFLTPPHYTNSQDLIISVDYSWTKVNSASRQINEALVVAGWKFKLKREVGQGFHLSNFCTVDKIRRIQK